MKKIFLINLLFLGLVLNAQVGIKTATPVNTLDINGDLNVNKDIRVGGSDATKGSSGVAQTIFHNNSALTVNDWKSIRIADGQGSMSLFSMNTVSDQTGIRFSGTDGSTNPYAEDLDLTLTSDWVVLPGAVDVFSVTNGINKVVFTFQTTAQKTVNGNSDANASISFACGIFVDNKLKAVRTDVLLGGDGTNKIFNLNATLTNINQKSNYSVKAACTKRNLNSGTLGIGRAVNVAFLNADMSQSVLTTSVLQPY